MSYIKLYLVALFIFFSIDLLWLGILAKNLYREELGHLMADSILWIPAIIFYLLFAAGLLIFAILPAIRLGKGAIGMVYGAFFGLVCYATYDLTNLATLSGWPVKIVVYDLMWGTALSGFTSLISFKIGSHWKSSLH